MKLGEQWIEMIDGQEHMVKVVEQSNNINDDTCGGCYFGVCGDICNHGALHFCRYGTGKCPLDNVDWIIKDLGILKDGLLPCNFCGEYTEILKGKLGYRIRHVCRDSYVMAGTGIYETKQEAIDAWNGRS